ncbi:MAG: hypothetical protein V4603_03245, partial [Pseudomonadota bacterium]
MNTNKNKPGLRILTTAVLLALGAPVLAQNLMITNARILDGNGGIINNGSVIIRDGKIESVVTGAVRVPEMTVLDAGGKTVMPGFVEAHRHVITGNPSTWLAERSPAQMQEFLDAGFTTVLSAIDGPPIVAAR